MSHYRKTENHPRHILMKNKDKEKVLTRGKKDTLHTGGQEYKWLNINNNGVQKTLEKYL